MNTHNPLFSQQQQLRASYHPALHVHHWKAFEYGDTIHRAVHLQHRLLQPDPAVRPGVERMDSSASSITSSRQQLKEDLAKQEEELLENKKNFDVERELFNVERKELQQKIAQLRRQAQEQVLAVLSTEQQRAFREAIGEPFEFDDGGRYGPRSSERE